MRNKNLTILVALLIIPLVISACGGVDLGDPESAAGSFFDAAEDQDAEKLKETVCEAYRESDNFPDFEYEDDENVDYTFDLVYEEESQEGDEAFVNVYGRIDINISDENFENELKRRTREDEPLEIIRLVKEGDDWKVCDSSAFGLMNLFVAPVDPNDPAPDND